MINRKATIKWKGYDPNDLSPNSHKKVWRVCDKCQRGKWISFRDCVSLCIKCSRSGENNGMFGKKQSNETKREIGAANKGKQSRLGCKLSDNTKKKISIGNTGKIRSDDFKENVRNQFMGIPKSEDHKRKIGTSNKGKIISEETKKILREKNLGEKNPNFGRDQSGSNNVNWKGGITSKDSLFRTSEEYKQWRVSIFKRDNYLCQECGKNGNLNAHHILPYRDWKEPKYSLNIDNGITLCIDCHKETYRNEYEFFNMYFDKIHGIK